MELRKRREGIPPPKKDERENEKRKKEIVKIKERVIIKYCFSSLNK